MFYTPIFRTKFWQQKLQSCVLGLKFFVGKISYKKRTRKKLMKLRQGSIMISFYVRRFKKCKKTHRRLDFLFAFLGSLRMLLKSTPGVNFTNIL
jgi:hypothetical protein